MITRRRFARVLGIAGAAGALGVRPLPAATELPPETTRIRLPLAPVICLAPQYIAEELLRAEGFSEVAYVPLQTGTAPAAVAAGRADLAMWEILSAISLLDDGEPITLLAGVHSGCWDLYGNERVRSIKDLKGNTVAVYAERGGDRILLSSMLAYVGLDPVKDVTWVWGPTITDGMRLLAGLHVLRGASAHPRHRHRGRARAGAAFWACRPSST